eukprot:767124-Amphidinium_carterae.2
MRGPSEGTDILKRVLQGCKHGWRNTEKMSCRSKSEARMQPIASNRGHILLVESLREESKYMCMKPLSVTFNLPCQTLLKFHRHGTSALAVKNNICKKLAKTCVEGKLYMLRTIHLLTLLVVNAVEKPLPCRSCVLSHVP